jgi:DNA-binding transcriptional regulator YbjK
MTYHFNGMDDLLTQAFTRFADQAAADTEQLLGEAKTPEEAQLAIAALIDRGASEDPRNLEIAHELYTLAARNPAYRAITHRWLERSRHTLERHFDTATARILDALIEGLTLHQALDQDIDNHHLALDAVRRIVAAASPTSYQPAAS